MYGIDKTGKASSVGVSLGLGWGWRCIEYTGEQEYEAKSLNLFSRSVLLEYSAQQPKD